MIFLEDSFFLGYDCQLIRGNGQGSGSHPIYGSFTLEKCIQLCVDYRVTAPNYNGLTINKDGCHCVADMRQERGSIAMMSCFPVEKIINQSSRYLHPQKHVSSPEFFFSKFSSSK